MKIEKEFKKLNPAFMRLAYRKMEGQNVFTKDEVLLLMFEAWLQGLGKMASTLRKEKVK